MPYTHVDELPKDQTKDYSPGAKRRFLSAYNAVHGRHKDEARALKVAHAAATKHDGKHWTDDLY